ncbi:helix-turn-helix domain-containing protein [Clostridium sp. YIM B02551]|uniref:helix-turn-helix domain-containing protein n=1 Tax=Clostridium sp. YIM B02551 TaxID=2910679 RepID=UPI001EECDF34|nr:helix-turn-helix transcriptional regulator [Clostridium sp. YIM B02551]
MCGIGNYIETNRNKQNMSIRELAKKAGISHTEINKIENGTRQKPSAKNLKLIAKALQLPQLDLLIKANYISDLPASIKSIFLECSDLTEQEILQVCRFIKFIKRERFEKSSERLNDNDI